MVEDNPMLPDYVVINDPNIPDKFRSRLRIPSETVSFPLSKEDEEILSVLEAKHDFVKGNVTGLAAPQIGFNKKMIIFAVNPDPDIAASRLDFQQTMPRTIWINPTYHPITEQVHIDYELCLSVANIVGLVKRYTTINYTANLPDGSVIEGEATGFLARIIQHEIDHLNGILFIDIMEKESAMSFEEYQLQILPLASNQ